MAEQSPPSRLEPRVVDALFCQLIRTLSSRAEPVEKDGEDNFAVFRFGGDYLVLRRETFPDDSQAKLYTTDKLLRAMSVALAGVTECTPIRLLMQLKITCGARGMVGWQCSSFQRIPLSALEVAVLIESRLAVCSDSDDEDDLLE